MKPSVAARVGGRYLEGSLGQDGYEFHRLEPATTVARFQVLGQRCSGTNFLSALIERNTALSPSEHLGWTHGFPSSLFIPSDMLVVIVFRDPFDWIGSLFLRPWHFESSYLQKSFAQFVRSPVITQMDASMFNHYPANAIGLHGLARGLKSLVRNQVWPKIQRRLGVSYPGLSSHLPEMAEHRALQLDLHPITGEAFPNPMQMRRCKNSAYLGFRERGCNLALVQYEYADRAPEELLAKLSDFFGTVRNMPYLPVTERLGQITDENARRERHELDCKDKDCAFIRANLDLAQEASLGYPDLPARAPYCSPAGACPPSAVK